MWMAILLSCASVSLAQGQNASGAEGGKKMQVYVGTYTNGKSQGIYLLEMDPDSGMLGEPRVAGKSASPSFLAIHPSRRFLYAVNEAAHGRGESAGAISAFAIDPQGGGLRPLNEQSSRGAGPCHLIVDRAGRNVLAANYGGGSVVVLPLEADGRLRPASAFVQHRGKGSDPSRQEGPHGHSINLDAANRFAVAADLGLDQLLVYRFDAAKGTLTPNDPPFTKVAAGAGPRHFAFHPDGRHAYVINEMHLTVTAFDYDPERGTLTEIQTISTLPEGQRNPGGYSTAEVQVHPSGKFLYGSNRGHNTIAIFAVDPQTGKLTPVGHQSTQGKTPRNFGIDPSGRFLIAANQDSGTLVVFRIDPATCRLQPTGQTVEVPAPVCVKFVVPGV